MDKQSFEDFATKLKQIQIHGFPNVNFFFATGMNTLETKHSAFIAWLLKPYEPHLLNTFMLKEFFNKIFEYDGTKNTSYGTPIDPNKKIINDTTSISDYNVFEKIVDDAYNAYKIDPNNAQPIKIETEYPTDIPDKNKGKLRIDILIDIPCENNKTVIVIENKVFAPLSANQLGDYYEYITSRDDKYKSYENKIFVFLTPNGDFPHCGTKNKIYDKRWCIFDYGEIYKIVSELLQSNKLNGQTKLQYILEDYMEIIKKEILNSADPRSVLENQANLNTCKELLKDKNFLEVFEVVKYYQNNFATYFNVLEYCKKWLKDNIQDLVIYNENEKSFCCCTKKMQDYFIDNGETDYKSGWRCLCGTSSKEDLVGFFQVYKTNAQNWSSLQDKFINTYKLNAGNTQASVETQVKISLTEDRNKLLVDIIQKLDKEILPKFKDNMESFEQKLLSL